MEFLPVTFYSNSEVLYLMERWANSNQSLTSDIFLAVVYFPVAVEKLKISAGCLNQRGRSELIRMKVQLVNSLFKLLSQTSYVQCFIASAMKKMKS